MTNFIYSKLSLSGKILVPMLSVFLGVWTVGTVSVGYLATQKQARDLSRETQNAAAQISQNISDNYKLLTLKAQSITDIESLSQYLIEADQRALLKNLLPRKASLELDLVKVVDTEGEILADLRSPVVSSATLHDADIIALAKEGLLVNSLVTAEASAPPLLVKTVSITSRQDDVGILLVGYALTAQSLSKILGNSRQHIVLLKDSDVIVSTLPVTGKVDWLTQFHPSQSVPLDGISYLIETIELSELADTRFQAFALTPLTEFQASQQQLWLLVCSLGLIGGLLISMLGLWITRLITHRISKLTEATQALAEGDLSIRIPVAGNDEVATLAIGFNNMAEQLKKRDQKIQTQLEELERLVQELRQMPEKVHTERMAGLGQMVAGVAHEINNPVSFIYGNISPARDHVEDLLGLLRLYQQHVVEPPAIIQETEETLDIDFVRTDLLKLLISMHSGAKRIREIVLSLRNFSRKDESVMKSVDIHEGLDSTLVLLEHRLRRQPKRPAINLVKRYGHLPEITCCAGEINQVFMNVLNNAIDALEDSISTQVSVPVLVPISVPVSVPVSGQCEHSTEAAMTQPQSAQPQIAQPQITIITEAYENDWISVRITDNGPGIPEEIRNKLFDPFFTTKSIGKGTGLGLTISYQIIVEKHGGKITLSDSARNSASDRAIAPGTDLLIHLPIKPASP